MQEEREGERKGEGDRRKGRETGYRGREKGENGEGMGDKRGVKEKGGGKGGGRRERRENKTAYICLSCEKFLSRTFLLPKPIPVMPCTRQILIESLRTFFMCFIQVLQIPFFQIKGL